jgi:hypothetical protein
MKFSAYDWRELLKLVAFLAVSVGYWAHKITDTQATLILLVYVWYTFERKLEAIRMDAEIGSERAFEAVRRLKIMTGER